MFCYVFFILRGHLSHQTQGSSSTLSFLSGGSVSIVHMISIVFSSLYVMTLFCHAMYTSWVIIQLGDTREFLRHISNLNMH